jgi:hypothetical protein
MPSTYNLFGLYGRAPSAGVAAFASANFEMVRLLVPKLNNHVVCNWLFVLQHALPRLDCVSSKHVWAYLPLV